MLYASEKQLPKEMTLPLLKQMAEKEEKAVVHGAVHVIREMGDVSFVMLRMATGDVYKRQLPRCDKKEGCFLASFTIFL